MEQNAEGTARIAEIGDVLKKQREKIKISQKEIARRLGYRNINFISMMEAGAALIPLNRMYDVVRAYEISEEMTFVMFAATYKQVWESFVMANKKMPNGENELTSLFEKAWEFYAKFTKSIGVISKMKKGEFAVN